MKLYRGYKEKPKLLIPKLKEELERLRQENDKHVHLPIQEHLRNMGKEKMLRKYELEKIAGSQFFTDDEQAAREFAGDQGFVIVLDVPDLVAMDHFAGSQTMAPAGIVRYVTNFVFSGDELYGNPEWKMDLIEVGMEKKNDNREIVEKLRDAEKRINEHGKNGELKNGVNIKLR